MEKLYKLCCQVNYFKIFVCGIVDSSLIVYTVFEKSRLKTVMTGLQLIFSITANS